MADREPTNTPFRRPGVQGSRRWYVPSGANQRAGSSVRVTAVRWATTADPKRRTALGRVVMGLRDEVACQNMPGARRSVPDGLDEVC